MFAFRDLWKEFDSNLNNFLPSQAAGVGGTLNYCALIKYHSFILRIIRDLYNVVLYTNNDSQKQCFIQTDLHKNDLQYQCFS